MATVALVHGASSTSAYWARVIPILEAAGHRCVAPDLPISDGDADFTVYADAVVAALGGGGADVVVGQSLGAFTTPIVAQRCGAGLIVLVAPMIPSPGESPAELGGHVGLAEAQAEYAAAGGFDPAVTASTLLHDVPPETLRELAAVGEPEQSPAIFDRPFPLEAWPPIPTRVIAGTADRLFPFPLTQRLAKERLAVDHVEEIDSGHMPGLARPEQLATMLRDIVDADARRHEERG